MASLLVAATLLSYTSIKSARSKRAEKKRSRADARVEGLRRWEEEEKEECGRGMTEKGKVEVGKQEGELVGRGDDGDDEGWRSEDEEDEAARGSEVGRGRGRITEEEEKRGY